MYSYIRVDFGFSNARLGECDGVLAKSGRTLRSSFASHSGLSFFVCARKEAVYSWKAVLGLTGALGSRFFFGFWPFSGTAADELSWVFGAEGNAFGTDSFALQSSTLTGLQLFEKLAAGSWELVEVEGAEEMEDAVLRFLLLPFATFVGFALLPTSALEFDVLTEDFVVVDVDGGRDSDAERDPWLARGASDATWTSKFE